VKSNEATNEKIQPMKTT